MACTLQRYQLESQSPAAWSARGLPYAPSWPAHRLAKAARLLPTDWYRYKGQAKGASRLVKTRG
jgi:hypothetical protein